MAKWRTDVPHQGWEHQNCTYHRNTEHVCEMCNREKIKYVHTITHLEGHKLEVGKLCAKNCVHNPEEVDKAERLAVNREGRLKNWMTRRWQASYKGNIWYKTKGNIIIIFKYNGVWRVKINEIFGVKPFQTLEEAKYAAFFGLEWYHKQKLK